jgi:hypothetical protein
MDWKRGIQVAVRAHSLLAHQIITWSQNGLTFAKINNTLTPQVHVTVATLPYMTGSCRYDGSCKYYGSHLPWAQYGL